MASIRRRMKTSSRRVKRTKTKNTRKQKRNRAFRKSRRHVNRGGTHKRSRGAMEDNWQTDTRTEKEKSEQDAIENKKDKKNELKRVANIKKNMYLAPLGESSKDVRVDQTEQLDLTEKQQGLMDDIDAESEGEQAQDLKGGPLSFGGKKKRAAKKK